MNIEEVLANYRDLIWHIINRFVISSNIPYHNTDDIYQEVCLRLFQKLPTYNPGLSSMKTFVASNTDIVCLRYRREYFKNEEAWIDSIESVAATQTSETMFNLVEHSSLTDFDKQIVVGKLLGYTQQEIARKYAISQSTVSRILSRFRDELIETMKD